MKTSSTKAIKFVLNQAQVTISISTAHLIILELTRKVFPSFNDLELEMTKTGSNAFKPGETVTVISRNNGWLTVDPMTFSRKNAFEKRMKGNLHKTSHMSPSWMHTDAQRDEEKLKQFKPMTVKRQNLRCESNRLYLADRIELPKSVFNLG